MHNMVAFMAMIRYNICLFDRVELQQLLHLPPPQPPLPLHLLPQLLPLPVLGESQ